MPPRYAQVVDLLRVGPFSPCRVRLVVDGVGAGVFVRVSQLVAPAALAAHADRPVVEPPGETLVSVREEGLDAVEGSDDEVDRAHGLHGFEMTLMVIGMCVCVQIYKKKGERGREGGGRWIRCVYLYMEYKMYTHPRMYLLS